MINAYAQIPTRRYYSDKHFLHLKEMWTLLRPWSHLPLREMSITNTNFVKEHDGMCLPALNSRNDNFIDAIGSVELHVWCEIHTRWETGHISSNRYAMFACGTLIMEQWTKFMTGKYTRRSLYQCLRN